MKTEDDDVIADGKTLRVPLMMMDSVQRSIAGSPEAAALRSVSARTTLDRSHDFAAAYRRDHEKRKALDAALHGVDQSTRDAARAGLAAAPVADALARSHDHAAIWRAEQMTREVMKRERARP